MKITVNNVDIELTQEQVNEIAAKAAAQKPPKPTAEKWLRDFIRGNKFETEIGDGFIKHSLDGNWVFFLNLKDKYFYGYYYKVWKNFEDDYSMDYAGIQQLYRKVVLKDFNCEGFTPSWYERDNVY